MNLEFWVPSPSIYNLSLKGEEYLGNLQEMLEGSGQSWNSPHLTENLEETVAEWWFEERKITLYLESDPIEYIKVWGTDTSSEMEGGFLEAPSDFLQVWEWLYDHSTDH